MAGEPGDDLDVAAIPTREELDSVARDAPERADRARELAHRARDLAAESERADDASAQLLGDRVDPRLWEYRRDRARRLLELGVDDETATRLRRLYDL